MLSSFPNAPRTANDTIRTIGRGARDIRPPGKEEATKARIAFLVCLIVLLIGYAASGKILSSVSEPPEINFALPASELTPKVAAFSGVWEASQAGFGPNRVAVERVNDSWATMLQFWPSDSIGNSKGVWRRVRARVLPSGELLRGYPVVFTLRIAEDGATLELKMQRAGANATTTLRRVGAS